VTISRFAVKRKVTVLMGILVVILLGAFSTARLPVDLFPKASQPAAAVLTSWPDAGATEVEAAVTRLVEQSVSALANVARIESTSQPGLSVVTVQFAWGTGLDIAALEMRDRMESLRRHLPEAALAPVVVKFDPTLMPVMVVTVTGEDQANLREFADQVLCQRLASLPGVGAVTVAGGAESEIVVDVDQQALAAAGISQTQLLEAVRAATSALPGGRITERGRDFIVRSLGQARDIDQLARVVVGVRTAADGGSGVTLPVRLMDVADVTLVVGPGSTRARLNGQAAVVLSVAQASTGSSPALTGAALAAIADLAAVAPADATIAVTLNQAAFSTIAMVRLQRSLLWGVALAVTVLAAVLLQVAGTAIVILALPLSIAAALALVFFGRMSANLMTLGGLALVSGILLYSSIVVYDSIARRIKGGELPGEAAVNGTGEVSGSIVAALAAFVAVLIPLMFLGGGAGVLYREFALTVGFAAAVSLLMALTVLPLASSIFCRPARAEDQLGGSASTAARLYGITIAATLRNRRLVLGFVLLLLLVGGRATLGLGVDYLPRFDRGEFVITLQMAPGTSIDRTDAAVREVEAAAMSMAEVRYVTSMTGSSGPLALAGEQGGVVAGDVASVAVTLVPKAYRAMTTREVMAEIDRRLWLPGVRLTYEELSLPPGASPVAQVQVMVQGPEIATLADLGNALQGALARVDGLTGLQVSSTRGQPEITVAYSAERLATHGLSIADAATQVKAALTGNVGGYLDVPGSPNLAVILRYDDGQGMTMSNLRAIRLVGPTGSIARLDEVATIGVTYGTALIERVDGQRAILATGAVSGRALGAVMADVRRAAATVTLPPGYTIALAGDGAAIGASASSLAWVLAIAVLLVFMVLAAHMESLLHPLAAMAVVPLAAAGSLIALRLSGLPLSAIGAIAVLLLVGVTVNHSVLLVDTINSLRKRGLAREVAVSVAGRDRLRPILLSAAVSVVAMLPLAVLPAEGSELMTPVVVALAGGIVTGAIATLTVIPVLYVLLDDLAVRLFSRPGRDPLDVSDLLA
jgi:HAE1 family hydrophobic/amphiphilic exporter-1